MGITVIRGLALLFVVMIGVWEVVVFRTANLPWIVLVGACGVLSSFSFFALGFAVAVVPFFGPLSVFVASWLLGREVGGYGGARERISSDSAGGAFFLRVLCVVFVAGATITVFSTLDPITWVREGGSFALLDGGSTWGRAIASASRYAVCLFLFPHCCSAGVKNRSHLLSGLALGGVGSAIVAGVQAVVPAMVLAGNQGAFWLSIHRYSGLYSDPNAFGVVTALLVPLLWIQSGRAGKGVAAVLLIGGLLSGSRTMILGIAVWGVATLWCFVLSRSQRVMLVVGGVVLLGAIGEPSLNDTLRSVLPSTTSERVLRTVNWDTAGEMVWNRSLYSQLAIGAWRRAPFTGVGLERFYEIQGEVASEQGRDLAGWRDNANNFYLKILAEMGAVGLVLTVGALLAFGWSLKKSDPINPVLLSLAVMLLTGPHLDFDEVKYLATVLLAFASAPAVVGLSHRVIVGGVMALYGGAVVVNYRTPLDWGLYPVESLEGKHYRWSSGVGYFTVCADRPIAIRFRSLEPAVAAHPIEVRFTVADGGEEAQRIASNSWHTLQIPTEGRQRVRFVVDRVWSPKAAGLGADARSLGIYLEWPETACRK